MENNARNIKIRTTIKLNRRRQQKVEEERENSEFRDDHSTKRTEQLKRIHFISGFLFLERATFVCVCVYMSLFVFVMCVFFPKKIA